MAISTRRRVPMATELRCGLKTMAVVNSLTHVVAQEQAAYDIRALDMDRDGDLDLLIAGQQSLNVVWYENPRK